MAIDKIIFCIIIIKSNIIYQLSDIKMDDQIPEGEIQSVIYQTRYFVPNIRYSLIITSHMCGIPRVVTRHEYTKSRCVCVDHVYSWHVIYMSRVIYRVTRVE